MAWHNGASSGSLLLAFVCASIDQVPKKAECHQSVRQKQVRHEDCCKGFILSFLPNLSGTFPGSVVRPALAADGRVHEDAGPFIGSEGLP